MINTIVTDKAVVVPPLGDSAILENQDFISSEDCGKTMGDQDTGSGTDQWLDRRLDQGFRDRIKGGCRLIEDEHGRVRVERWAARTLDLDLITYGTVIHSDDELTLPHPRAAERAFVLEPWSHLDPDAELPGVGRVVDLARNTSDRAGIRWMALDWLKQ